MVNAPVRFPDVPEYVACVTDEPFEVNVRVIPVGFALVPMLNTLTPEKLSPLKLMRSSMVIPGMLVLVTYVLHVLGADETMNEGGLVVYVGAVDKIMLLPFPERS